MIPSSLTSISALPGNPWENGYAESFHSRLRDEFLGLELFDSLHEAKRLTAAWREDYNHARPHSSLGYQTPAKFAAVCAAADFATLSPQPHTRRGEENPVPVP